MRDRQVVACQVFHNNTLTITSELLSTTSILSLKLLESSDCLVAEFSVTSRTLCKAGTSRAPSHYKLAVIIIATRQSHTGDIAIAHVVPIAFFCVTSILAFPTGIPGLYISLLDHYLSAYKSPNT